MYGGIKIKNINKYGIVIIFLILCSAAIAIPPKITEPHTRFNPWMNECVYFFTFGQCYVDPDHCSKEYGKNAMEDVLVILDKEEVCIYDREEYHKYLEEKESGVKEREPQINKGPFNFIIEETEHINLLPRGYDPDEDILVYHFTTPLNAKGEWQTDYGDAGEYTVTVTVSDGEMSTSQDAVIIVNKKEEAPTIESFSPFEENIAIDENSNIEFSVIVTDKNDDELTYKWAVDGEDVSSEESYVYEAGYDSAGEHTIELTISDGVKEVIHRWILTVRNVNRKPELNKIQDITVKETEIVEIKPEILDEDGDEVTYTISDPVGNDGTWETTYDDAGDYTVTVTITDNEDEVSQEVEITVENVNRAPIIIDVWNEA